MKATEFFKSMGMDAVKGFIKNGNIRSPETELELKRLVASHELVMEFGDDASYLKEHLLRNPTIKEFYLDSWCRTFSVVRLKQAIADVEACQ